MAIKATATDDCSYDLRKVGTLLVGTTIKTSMQIHRDHHLRQLLPSSHHLLATDYYDNPIPLTYSHLFLHLDRHVDPVVALLRG